MDNSSHPAVNRSGEPVLKVLNPLFGRSLDGKFMYRHSH